MLIRGNTVIKMYMNMENQLNNFFFCAKYEQMQILYLLIYWPIGNCICIKDTFKRKQFTTKR